MTTWGIRRGNAELGILLVLLLVLVCAGLIIYFMVWQPPPAQGQMRVFPPTTSTATSLAANPADCAANTFATAIAANGDLTCTSVPNAATTAVAGNTVNAIVARDINGDFAARQINAALVGNAGTATQLANNPADCAANTFAQAIDTFGTLTCAAVGNAATTATATNTASAIVARDGSGNFSAGTISAALTGNASTATALAANPADCAANTFAQSIDASGTLTCAGVSLSTADTTGTLTVAKGGNGAAPGADDQVAVSDSTSAATWRSLPNCTDATGNHLNYTAATNTFSCGTSSSATSSGVSGCQIRLTATSGTPITTADVTGATNLYVTPFGGNKCLMADGTTVSTVSEVTVALGTITSGLPYDVFCYDNSGTLACDAPLAWTNGTTRATALTLTNGRYAKNGATTRLYIGTFYTTATTTTEDSAAKRYVWNYYNRKPRPMVRFETASTWTYAPADSTVRQANANASNQLELVVGLLEEPIEVSVMASLAVSLANNGGAIMIGEDSTTTPIAGSRISFTSDSTTLDTQVLETSFRGFAGAVGRHVYSWNERCNNTATCTFYGTQAVSPPTWRSGMTGWVWG